MTNWQDAQTRILFYRIDTTMRRIILIILTAAATLPALAQDEYSQLIDKAMEMTRMDSLVQAEELYRKALSLDPGNARNALLFSNLGTVLSRQGKVKEAIEAYSMAINITPYSTAMLLNRAALYLECNMPDKAYTDYCRVIDLLPEDTEAHLMRAYINMRRRQYMEARNDYNVVLTREPGHKTARIGIAMLDEKEGRYQAATEGLRLLILDYPRDPSLLKMRANIYITQNYLELALLDLNEASALDHNDPDIFLTMGDVCLRLKKKREARASYERAIALGIARKELADQLKKCK